MYGLGVPSRFLHWVGFSVFFFNNRCLKVSQARYGFEISLLRCLMLRVLKSRVQEHADVRVSVSHWGWQSHTFSCSLQGFL